MLQLRRPKGFTLIELMIVVAILSIISLIAIPRFANLIRKSREATTKGHLGSLRSALLLYYMENDQVYPIYFSGMLQADNRYMKEQPLLYTGHHDEVNVVDDLPDISALSDIGHWAYVSAGQDKNHFYVQCVHNDLTGTPWSTY